MRLATREAARVETVSLRFPCGILVVKGRSMAGSKAATFLYLAMYIIGSLGASYEQVCKCSAVREERSGARVHIYI